MADVILHQFQFSHFNDKARWVIALKGLPCRRVSYLPGPHMAPIRRLSGQRQTPVLTWDERVIAGSAAIIDFLERQIPDPALYPSDPALRQRALALQQRYDEQIGPAVRTALFSRILQAPDYLVAMFAQSKPWLQRAAYRTTLPLVKGLIARGNGADDPDNVARCFDTVGRELDALAGAVADTGYLAGEVFSVADLTAAALFAPLANPLHPDMHRPEPIPGAMVELLERYADHPAIGWVNHMYASHRPG